MENNIDINETDVNIDDININTNDINDDTDIKEDNNIILQLENEQLIIINNVSHQGEIHTLLRNLTEEKLHQMLYNICTNLINYYKKSINSQD